MARDTGIADRLRRRGLKVVEVDGWKTRGKVEFAPLSSVNHHTAGAAHGNAPSLGVCINGRSDLPGPLCHVLLARDGTCYLIAAGKANHAGQGGWRGLTGNSTAYGLEIENVGTQAEPWTPETQRIAYQIHAGLLDAVPASQRVLPCHHKEWAPHRKNDAHDPWTGDQLRAGVMEALNPTPIPHPPEDPFMALTDQEQRELLENTRGVAYLYDAGAKGKHWYVRTGNTATHVSDDATLAMLKASGFTLSDNGGSGWGGENLKWVGFLNGPLKNVA